MVRLCRSGILVNSENMQKEILRGKVVLANFDDLGVSGGEGIVME